MKPSSKEAIKHHAPSLGAVLIAIATAIGGLFSWLDSREKSRLSEVQRIEADKVLLDELAGQFEGYAKETNREIDDLVLGEKACNDQLVELRIRVGVLERSAGGGGAETQALLEELREAVRKAEGAPVATGPPQPFVVPPGVTVSDRRADLEEKRKKANAASSPSFEAKKAEIYDQIQQKAW